MLMSIAAAVVIVTISLIFWLTYEPKVGGNFKMNFSGRQWSFSDDAKKLNLLYIGYAKCPDVCPLSLSFASQSFRDLTKQEIENTRLLFVSVDFKNETPEAVAIYAGQFHNSFVGLSGNQKQIDDAVNLFGASYMVEKNATSYLGYSIAHTDRIFFLDQKGYVVATLSNPRSSEAILNEIRKLQ